MSPSALNEIPSNASMNGSDGTACLEGSDGGVALAVFTCCQQSHPFDERRVELTADPIKVGRSVARIRPQSDNGIFDCKVLSRNHAVMWVQDGKFYLKDTKSSNGTFVNNQRLSKGSEESPPKEVFSGDIIQFGVDIMENSKKVTHGCIIALVRLFNANGDEAASRSSFESSSLSAAAAPVTSAITTQELYQLQQYLKEAAYREQLLEQKLSTLQTLLMNTHEASQDSWQALIDEDRLLSRIELLESQLQVHSKNMNEEKLREEVNQLQIEKHRRENQAKEALRKALEEKIEAVQKLADVERSLENTEDECGRLRTECEFATAELEQMAQLQNKTHEEIATLTNLLEEKERNFDDFKIIVDNEKHELEARISEMCRQESILTAKLEALQDEYDLNKEQIAAMKLRRDSIHGDIMDEPTDRPIIQFSRLTEQALSDISDPLDERMTRLADLLRDAQAQIDSYKMQMETADDKLENDRRIITKLQDQLHLTKEELANSQNLTNTLEERIKLSEEEMINLVNQATAELKTQLDETLKHKQQSEDLCNELRERVVELESQMAAQGIREPSRSASLPNGTILGLDGTLTRKSSVSSETLVSSSYSEDVNVLEDRLAKAIQAKELAEAELDKYKEELESSRSQHTRSQEDVASLRKQNQDNQNQATQAQGLLENLREKLEKKEDQHRQLMSELESLKKDMGSGEKSIKEQREDNEKLRAEIKSMTVELEFQRSLQSTLNMDSDKEKVALHRQAARNKVEFANLRKECGALRSRIGAIEKDMRNSHKENSRLTTENVKLVESNRDLDRVNLLLKRAEKNLDSMSLKTYDSEVSLSSLNSNFDPMLASQLTEAQKELAKLRSERDSLSDELTTFRANAGLEPRLSRTPSVHGSLEDLVFRTRTRMALNFSALMQYLCQPQNHHLLIAVCSFIPLVMLALAFLMAYLPFFSSITATQDPPFIPPPDPSSS